MSRKPVRIDENNHEILPKICVKMCIYFLFSVGIGNQFPNGVDTTGQLGGTLVGTNFANFRPQYSVPGQSSGSSNQSYQGSKN